MTLHPAKALITVSVFYPLTQVGKRRGGVFLKTGMVAKKLKDESEVSEEGGGGGGGGLNIFLFIYLSPF